METSSWKKIRLRAMEIIFLALEVPKVQNVGDGEGVMGGYDYML